MIGETIGNFKVVSRLGMGGMGEVWLAEQQSIGTRVAIKLLNASISQDTEHVQRFFNEARAVSRIQHAGIVKIFDVGHHAGQAYLIMEYLDGETLAQRLAKNGRLPFAQIGDIGRQIATVLDATHSAGITHRDLKPDNVFLVPDTELGERVKILDFGIAKLTGTLAGVSPRTIGTMGTPAYMAPEQWGDTSKVDWRADLYSLGCLAFEMTCGRPPFVVTTIAEACGKHLNERPPRASSLAPTVPAKLEQLLAQLLAKDPRARPASMLEVARAFELVDTHALGSAPTVPIAPVSLPIAAMAPKRSVPIGQIFLGILALAGGATGAIYLMQRDSSAPGDPGQRGETAVAVVSGDADVIAKAASHAAVGSSRRTAESVSPPSAPTRLATVDAAVAPSDAVPKSAAKPPVTMDAAAPPKSTPKPSVTMDAAVAPSVVAPRSTAKPPVTMDGAAPPKPSVTMDAAVAPSDAAPKSTAKGPKPSVEGADNKPADGNADAEAIHQAVRARSAQTNRCYEAALHEDPSLTGGTVTLRINIDGSGRVIDAAADGFSEKLQACLIAQVRDIKFPKPQGGTTSIIFPFRFERE